MLDCGRNKSSKDSKHSKVRFQKVHCFAEYKSTHLNIQIVQQLLCALPKIPSLDYRVCQVMKKCLFLAHCVAQIDFHRISIGVTSVSIYSISSCVCMMAVCMAVGVCVPTGCVSCHLPRVDLRVHQ